MINTIQSIARMALNAYIFHNLIKKCAIHTSFVQGSQPDGERFGQQSGLLNEVLFHLAPKHMQIKVRFLHFFFPCKTYIRPEIYVTFLQ